jgi:hypothetical protein
LPLRHASPLLCPSFCTSLRQGPPAQHDLAGRRDNPSLELSLRKLRPDPSYSDRMIRISEYPRLESSLGKMRPGPDLFRGRFFGTAPSMRDTAWALGVTATRARQMQRDQRQAEHTIPSIRTGRQASERLLYCRKEFAAAFLSPHLAGRGIDVPAAASAFRFRDIFAGAVD